jgi:hypothetical protein
MFHRWFPGGYWRFTQLLPMFLRQLSMGLRLRGLRLRMLRFRGLIFREGLLMIL